MLFEERSTPETETGEFTVLERHDLLDAIEYARTERYQETEKALFELLSVLDSVLGVGGSIEYRVTASSMSA